MRSPKEKEKKCWFHRHCGERMTKLRRGVPEICGRHMKYYIVIYKCECCGLTFGDFNGY